MDFGWTLTTVTVACIGASIISRPIESSRLRDHVVGFGLPYVGLYIIGILIGYWAGIL